MNEKMWCKYQKACKRFVSDESGATALEYVLLTSVLAVGLIVGINGIAAIVTRMWGGVETDVTGV